MTIKLCLLPLPLLIAACAAGSARAPAPAAAPTFLSAADVYAARKAGFMMSAATVASMKRTIDADQDVGQQAFFARALAHWAGTIPAMFPPGTDVAGSKALPSVWADAAGFAAAAGRYQIDATKLADLAQAKDKAGFAAQWTIVRAHCDTCHTAYRAE